MLGQKKILHLITGLEIGGAEMMLLKVLPPLQNDFDNIVCCIRGRGPMGQRLEEAGVPVYYLELQSLFDWQVIKRFHKVVHKISPDLLVTYLIHADLFGRILGRLFGVPKIYCSVRAKLIQAKYLPLLLLDGITSSLVDHYHFNARPVMMLYQRFFFLSPKKCTVILNGLNTAIYKLSRSASEEKRKELGLAEATIILGCVAKLRAQKGHSYLLEAFQEFLTGYPQAILLLVGDGEERSILESLSKKLNIEQNTLFLGNRDDIPELLSILDIFVFPTFFEGMSNALMEAMASGLPIIATDIPENRELIASGITGLLVPLRNTSALYAAMTELSLDRRQREILGENAKKEAGEKFSLPVVVEEYRNFFAR
jgi:glycosyltransferase involved in cell wall biosynthesis